MGIELQQSLKREFGFADFLPWQREILERIQAGKSVLAVVPTGSGRTVALKMASKAVGGLTVVVTKLAPPDKVVPAPEAGGADRRSALGGLISKLGRRMRGRRAQQLPRSGLVYVSPARFRSRAFLDDLKECVPNLLVIDDVHSLSQWSHEYVSDYSSLPLVISHFKIPVVLGLSGCASPDVQDDILRELRIPGVEKVTTSFARRGLTLEASVCASDEEKARKLAGIVAKHQGSKGLLVADNEGEADEILAVLRELKARVERVPDLSDPAKERRFKEKFQSHRLDALVVTRQDKRLPDSKDMRYICLWSPPRSIEHLYDELSWAPEATAALLLATRAEFSARRAQIEQDAATPESVKQVFAGMRGLLQNRDISRRSNIIAKELKPASPSGTVLVIPSAMLASALKVSEQRLHSSIAELQQLRVLNRRMDTDEGELVFVFLRDDLPHWSIQRRSGRIRKILKRNLDRLGAIEGLYSNRRCLHHQISRYFGDKTAPERCELCSHCWTTPAQAAQTLVEKKPRRERAKKEDRSRRGISPTPLGEMVDVEQVRRASLLHESSDRVYDKAAAVASILQIVDNEAFGISKDMLVAALCHEADVSSRDVLLRQPAANGAPLTRQQAYSLINELVTKGLLQVEEQRARRRLTVFLQITANGRRALQSYQEQTAAGGADLAVSPEFALETVEDFDLSNRLREWRREESRRLGASSTTVLTDREIREISTKLPHSTEELAALGINARKLQLYGEQVLQMVAESDLRHSRSHAIAEGGVAGEFDHEITKLYSLNTRVKLSAIRTLVDLADQRAVPHLEKLSKDLREPFVVRSYAGIASRALARADEPTAEAPISSLTLAESETPSPLETSMIAVPDRAPETTAEVLDQHSDLGEEQNTDSELLDALTESTELKPAEPRPVRYSPRPLRGKFDWGYALDNNSRQVRGQWRRTQLGELLHRYKVRGDKELAPLLVDALADFYKAHPELDEAQPLLVTVPPSGDPSDPNGDSCHTAVELAQLLAQKVNLSLATDVLAKSRPTTPQREQQTLQKKQENVKDAFYVAHPEAVAGRSILILDDLADSGSTLSEAARVLKEAGANSVFAVTITKSTLRPHNTPRRAYHHRREPSSSPS